MARSTESEIIPLTPAVLHILLALSDQARHGYAIMQEIAVMSAGEFSVGPGTLYRSIRQLLEKSLIEELDDPANNDERRRIYRLTPEGRRVLRGELQRVARLIRTPQAHQLLEEGLA